MQHSFVHQTTHVARHAFMTSHAHHFTNINGWWMGGVSFTRMGGVSFTRMGGVSFTRMGGVTYMRMGGV